MQISDKHFAEFKRIYKEEFGEEEFNKRTEQELFEEATKLKSLMEIVYKHQNSPDNQSKIDKAYDILFEETLKTYRGEGPIKEG